MNEYIELVINDKLIKINKNDSMDVFMWRECKIKTSYWLKKKVSRNKDKRNGYKYYRVDIDGKSIILSRLVYKAHNPEWNITDNSKNNQIDHINVNSTDNRIENLRVLTDQYNKCNRKGKGYYWNKRRGKWRSNITISGNQIHLGYFDKEEDAREAYLNAKEIHHKFPVI